jgi:hypothetical protein
MKVAVVRLPLPCGVTGFRHDCVMGLVFLFLAPGSRDGVHRLHWSGGNAVVYLVNTGLCTEIADLFPPSHRQIECVAALPDFAVLPAMTSAVCDHSILSFKDATTPVHKARSDGRDPMIELRGSVAPPLPPLNPASPLFVRAGMRT